MQVPTAAGICAGQPPEALPKVTRGPRDILISLPEMDKQFLRCFLSLLYQDTKASIQKLFRRLDDNENNILSVQDFKHHNAAVDKLLKQMWEYFKKRFDFNDDDLITFDEFTQGKLSLSYLLVFRIRINRLLWYCLLILTGMVLQVYFERPPVMSGSSYMHINFHELIDAFNKAVTEKVTEIDTDINRQK